MLPTGAAMRGDRRTDHDESTPIPREALRAFVDVLQVLVGRVDTNEESATLVRALLMRMLRQLLDPPSAPLPTNFRIARVLSYLEEHFSDATICLASAAHHGGVTPSHLDRLLKEETGLTFLQHVRGIRMRHAERLLLLSNSSIKETAYACGYAGTGTFGRDFKRTHGCAVRGWRAMGSVCSVRDLKRADRQVR
jgi:AraC-like DNA-binding protein